MDIGLSVMTKAYNYRMTTLSITVAHGFWRSFYQWKFF